MRRLVNNVYVDMTEAEIAEHTAPRPVDPAAITSYRDQLINAGFVFEGVTFQTDSEARENAAGAATAALEAIMNGAAEGDLRWSQPDKDFGWIAADNSVIPMDAQTAFRFGKAMMAHKAALIFAARTLKDMDPIPQDWQDLAYWS